MMNFKLPGSNKQKRVLLIVLVIISIGILLYEHMSSVENKHQTQVEEMHVNEEKDETFVPNENKSEEDNGEAVKENIESQRENDLYNEAYRLFFENNYLQSIEKSNELVNNFPNNPRGYNIRGIAEAYNGDYENGLIDINKSLEIDSGYGYALFNKALIYELYGKYDDALEWYNKALEVEDYAWSYYGIASIYGRKGDVENTVKYLKRAIEIDESVKEEAKTERDFDPIRNSNEFQDLINN